MNTTTQKTTGIPIMIGATGATLVAALLTKSIWGLPNSPLPIGGASTAPTATLVASGLLLAFWSVAMLGGLIRLHGYVTAYSKSDGGRNE